MTIVPLIPILPILPLELNRIRSLPRSPPEILPRRLLLEPGPGGSYSPSCILGSALPRPAPACGQGRSRARRPRSDPRRAGWSGPAAGPGPHGAVGAGGLSRAAQGARCRRLDARLHRALRPPPSGSRGCSELAARDGELLRGGPDFLEHCKWSLHDS